MNTYYVLQRRKYNWSDKYWETLENQRYNTIEEATAALDAHGRFKFEYRIAEAYTVVRYKPVKDPAFRTQEEKPRVRDALKAAAEQAKKQSAQEHSGRGGDAR